jgi:hypothetical protein
MSEEMQLALEHTLKTMRELKEAKAEIKRLRAALRQIAGIDPWDNSEQGFVDKARAALAQETP